MAEARYAGNTAADAGAERLSRSLAALDAFFRDLPSYAGLPPSRILFVVDGLRYPDVAAASAGTYFDRMRRALLEKAASLGYAAIDLDPFFFEHHRRTGERPEFVRDAHWSSIGHGVAFNAVMASPFLGPLSVRAACGRDRLGRYAIALGRVTGRSKARSSAKSLRG